MADIFERLSAGRPATATISKRTQKLQRAQKLLDWLQHWDKPVVSERDFRIYGPRPRDRETVVGAAKILVKTGWLTPIQTHRYDRHVWQVVRRPIVYPDCSRVAETGRVSYQRL
jgi:hypothetical protein